MSLLAVITWSIAICFGLFLLGIWLVEYDRDSHRAAATRLPVPVLSAHALLAVAGVPVWLVYIVTDETGLAWASAIILIIVAVLGLTMAVGWLRDYRARRGAVAAAVVAAAEPNLRLAAVAPQRSLWLAAAATPVPTVAGRAWPAGTTGPASAGPAGAGPAGPAGPAGTVPASTFPAERNFPLAVVVGHGIFAVATIVLVLLAALAISS